MELDPTLAPRYYQNIKAEPAVCILKSKYINAPIRHPGISVVPGFDPAAMLYDDITVSIYLVYQVKCYLKLNNLAYI